MIKMKWEKGLFSSKYRLLDKDIEIGEFKNPAFNSSSFGTLGETKLKFKAKGIFSSETEIIDLNLDQSIGSIKFNSWGSKAEIRISDKKYIWKYDNFWHSKWSISENGEQLIRYKSSSSSGEIESMVDNELLLLCGFYVYNYYITLIIIISASSVIILSGR